MQPGMEIFFRRLAEAFVADGTFRLWSLDAGGAWAAGAIAFAFEGTVSLYNSAYDHGLRALAPGMVLVGELIREAIDEGCATFDLLKGGLAYKYRFGAVPRALLRLQIARR
jgi:CelD/BcsL family acetyltransferase involved in cellulose biosynthesis